jgi:hypothetical protein
MVVSSDKPTDFTVVTPSIGPNGKPIYFAAVLQKKSAVTYHLFPLYFNPKLQAVIDPALLPRKQGKTCFNFQRPDDALFAKLDELTQTARRQWEARGYLKGGQITSEQMEESLRAAGVDTAALARQRKQTVAKAAKERAVSLGKRSAGKSPPKKSVKSSRTR